MPLCYSSMFIRSEGFGLLAEKSMHISDWWLNSEPSGKSLVSYIETTSSSYKMHYIVTLAKSKKLWWAGMWRKWRTGNAFKFWEGNLLQGMHLEDHEGGKVIFS